jgi:hypothetical protein
MERRNANERPLNGPYYSQSISIRELETVKAETLIQRVARNVAWYALRIARPEYCNTYEVTLFRFVNIKGRQRLATHLHCDELLQSRKEQFGDTPPVPLHHVIFRG